MTFKVWIQNKSNSKDPVIENQYLYSVKGTCFEKSEKVFSMAAGSFIDEYYVIRFYSPIYKQNYLISDINDVMYDILSSTNNGGLITIKAKIRECDN